MIQLLLFVLFAYAVVLIAFIVSFIIVAIEDRDMVSAWAASLLIIVGYISIKFLLIIDIVSLLKEV